MVGVLPQLYNNVPVPRDGHTVQERLPRYWDIVVETHFAVLSL